MNEQDQFLKDLEVEESTDAFAHLEQETVVEEKKEDADDPELQPEEVKNRRHKRLEAKLQAEREANIALNARLATIAEAKQTASSPEYLKAVEKIYGMDSPETAAATEIMKNVLQAVRDEAERGALEKFEAQRREEAEAQRKEEAVLDSMLEQIEDEHGVDLTSAKADTARKGFLKLLERMSPKDSDGNILAYADPEAVWEIYKEKSSKKPENPAKALAARGMTHSGSGESTLQDDSTLRFLKENNLI